MVPQTQNHFVADKRQNGTNDRSAFYTLSSNGNGSSLACYSHTNAVDIGDGCLGKVVVDHHLNTLEVNTCTAIK